MAKVIVFFMILFLCCCSVSAVDDATLETVSGELHDGLSIESSNSSHAYAGTVYAAVEDSNLSADSKEDDFGSSYDSGLSAGDVEVLGVVDASGLSAGDVEVLGAGDVYFDASVASDGDGSQSNPYKTLSSSRLSGYSNYHFAPGNYTISSDVSSTFSTSAINFIGTNPQTTIIKYTGSGTFLESSSGISFTGITLKSVSIRTSGSINATNTIFDGGTAEVEDEDGYKFGNSYGGAVKITGTGSSFYDELSQIWGTNSTRKIIFENCEFINNYAAYGGAFYISHVNATFKGCKFSKNHADNGGGSILAVDGANVNITGCEFEEDYSFLDAGGSVHIRNASASIADTNFTSCRAGLGSAVASLNSNVSVNNIHARGNNATFEGGAIFAMFGSLSVKNSEFSQNYAQYGGAIFANNLTSFEAVNSRFVSNIAAFQAGAVYAYADLSNVESGNSYVSNEALKDEDYYASDLFEIFIGSDDYDMIQYNSSYEGVLPSRFDLRDYNAVTSLKEQANSGNCWAFATISTLESAIKKATGLEYDLSEGYLKNLAQMYSDFGWPYETNNGGLYPMALSVLVNWAAPVNESADATDDWDVISPLLNSQVHVQNILFLQRSSYTDNDIIKKAIMDYGAVATQICMQFSSSYINGGSYYYYGNESTNHAITIIGWDDNYSKSNFVKTPPGNGAWIVKNSYGTRWGNSGFGYVSYYDTRFAEINDQEYTFAFILNDTIRFNRNYQYDVGGKTDYFMNGADTLYYKNVFTSAGNDLLSAFSTYFNSSSDWTANIIVNGDTVLTQSGSSVPGYFTINLNEQIPLKIGDVFEIALKVHSQGITSFPISEGVATSKRFYKPGVSFVSFDGSSWIDLYDYSYTYHPDQDDGHYYSSQVACIKAFTSQGVHEVLNTTLEIFSFNNTALTLSVKDQNGENINFGSVEFVIDEKSYSAKVTSGLATVDLYLKHGSHNILAEYVENSFYHTANLSKNIEVGKEDLAFAINASDISYPEDLNLVFYLRNGANESIQNIPIIVSCNNQTFTVLDNQLKISGLAPSSYTIKASISESEDYNAQIIHKTINVFKITSGLKLEVPEVKIGNSIFIKAILPGVDGRIAVKLNGGNYSINLIGGEGNITIEEVLAEGSYTVTAEFSGNDYCNPINSSAVLKVVKHVPEISVVSNDPLVGDDAQIIVNLPGDAASGVLLIIDNKTYSKDPVGGMVNFTIGDLELGNHGYVVIFEGDAKYAALNVTGVLNVASKPREEVDAVLAYENITEGETAVISVDIPSSVTQALTLSINSQNYTSIPINGKVIFKVSDLTDGTYPFSISFKGNSDYTPFFLNGALKVSPDPANKNYSISLSNVEKYFRGNEKLEIFVEGAEFLDVSIRIDNESYIETTDENGFIYLDVSSLSAGEHEILISIPDTNSSTRLKITVATSIEANDMKRAYLSEKDFEARFYDADGGLLINETVLFSINGVDYYFKTNDYGYVKFSRKLPVGEYEVNIMNPRTGESVVKRLSIVKRISNNKNIAMDYDDGTLYKIRVYSDDSCAAAAGEKVKISVGGRSVFVLTDKNGYASYKINLKPGTYTISAEYRNVKVSNKVVVKSILKTKNISKKKAKKIKFTAVLKNSKGKALAGKKITFKVNKKKYTAKTNKKGLATIKIKNLKVGKYAIYTYYKAICQKNKIKIKK